LSAARRIKGVVRPHAMPTRRKPRVQLRIEGEGGGAVEGVEGEDIVRRGGRGGGSGMGSGGWRRLWRADWDVLASTQSLARMSGKWTSITVHLAGDRGTSPQFKITTYVMIYIPNWCSSRSHSDAALHVRFPPR